MLFHEEFGVINTITRDCLKTAPSSLAKVYSTTEVEWYSCLQHQIQTDSKKTKIKLLLC